MIRVWRLVTARWASSAFTGEGARLYGGRWNRKGTPVVYTAQSQALALLEMLVQDEPLRARYVVIPADIPDALRIERVQLEELPDDWTDAARLEMLRDIGMSWISSQRSTVLAVPSAVIAHETNYLLNPLHPDFRRVEIGVPMPFVTDMRLLRKVS